ncbi:hypothetical protein OsJ_27975 [Oryza sativa Japonica Group]|uniref:Uncharacterized protein n=2 Tax=Oryza TaxID=4527 RepID=A3BUY3_ORYSJ|nr:hypothetical protein OsJ_27975 [Oryza sativa Japonica Group]
MVPPAAHAPKNLGLRGVRAPAVGQVGGGNPRAAGPPRGREALDRHVPVPGGGGACLRSRALLLPRAARRPGNRAFNFPHAPRLRIDDRRRHALTPGHVRAIAERYAHDVGSVLFRPLPPPPPPVAAAAVPVFAAPAPPMAPAPANHAADPYYCNEPDTTTDEDVMAAADRLLSMDIEEVAALIAIVQQGE